MPLRKPVPPDPAEGVRLACRTPSVRDMPSLLTLAAAATLLGLAAFGGCGGATPDGPDVAADTSRTGLVADAVPAAPDTTPARPRLPDGFVRLDSIAPEIAQEMRYFTAYNFVGQRIDGYNAATCILTTQAARALRLVDDDLAQRGLGLKVYDCYRPQAGVDHFVRWARNGERTMKEGFYPTEPAETLFRRGYIATRSGHTRGSTVDLTLVRRSPTGSTSASIKTTDDYPDPNARPLPRCDRDRPDRFDDGDLDMGTAFDCLSPRAATDVAGIPPAARRNRDTLRSAMRRRGFDNYSKEWWHYTLRPEPVPPPHGPFPVE